MFNNDKDNGKNSINKENQEMNFYIPELEDESIENKNKKEEKKDNFVLIDNPFIEDISNKSNGSSGSSESNGSFNDLLPTNIIGTSIDPDDLEKRIIPVRQRFTKNISELTIKEVEKMKDDLINKWYNSGVKDNKNAISLFLNSFKALGLTENDISCCNDVSKISQLYEEELSRTLNILNYFSKNDILDKIDRKTEKTYGEIINCILEIMYYSNYVINGIVRVIDACDTKKRLDISVINENGPAGLIEKFIPRTEQDTSPFQKLLLYLFRTLRERKFRRHGDKVYKMVFTGNGFFSYAWDQYSSIEDFVYEATQKDKFYGQWLNSTHGKGNIKEAVNYLINCSSSVDFRELVMDRSVFAFRNGVYMCVCNKVKKGKKQTEEYKDFWYPFTSSYDLDQSLVACKYFDIDFNNYPELDDWRDIPTPNLQRILDYQFGNDEKGKEISEWMYIFMGRLFYDLRYIDKWQVIPYLYGIAGSGKSTICEVIRNFYGVNDVGVIEDNIEEKFGLAPICDKFIFIAPEVKKSFSLSQALFQKIISGEEVALPRKNKDPVQTVWRSPGFMASNETPGFNDSAGSISRRIIVFKFMNIVKQADPNLFNKLERETPAIIKKCNSAYLEAVNSSGGKDIWNLLPTYFHETRQNMAKETNVMKGFLGSGIVKFGKDIYCPEIVFKRRFQEYCNENNMGKPKWNESMYDEPFSNYSSIHNVEIKIKRVTRKYPRNEENIKPSNRKYILGIDLVDEDGENNE